MSESTVKKPIKSVAQTAAGILSPVLNMTGEGRQLTESLKPKAPEAPKVAIPTAAEGRVTSLLRSREEEIRRRQRAPGARSGISILGTRAGV